MIEYIKLSWDEMHDDGKFLSVADYVRWSHEWVQICSELNKKGKNAKIKQKEQEQYELFMAEYMENRFVPKRFQNGWSQDLS